MNINLNSMEFIKDLPDSKITEETFVGKRFERYIQKTTDAVVNEYIKTKFKRQFDNAIVLKSPSNSYRVKSLSDFVIALFQSYHHPLMEKFEHKDHVMHPLLRIYACPNPDLEVDKEFLQTYVLNAFSGDNDFSLMVEEEIRISCKKLIILKSELDNNIDDSNYFITIPKTLDQCAMFFIDIVNGVQLSLEHLFASNAAKAMCDFVSNEITQDMYNSVEEMKESLKILNNEVAKKDDTISFLKRKVEKLEKQIKESNKNKDSKHEELIEHNFQLARQNQKLKDKYRKLSFKKIQNFELENIEEKPIEQINNLDANGKYIFIGFDKNGFQEQVLKHLPQAKFQDTNADIHSSTDMVVMLTKHITHPTCLGVKEQCKNKGIPLVYCKHSNIDLIKDLMWNHIN